jgi:electron transfer flavoprotein beta subunit
MSTALKSEPGMKIYVCVKHVPDTAAKITIIGNNQIDEKITFIINPYDENAIEAAAGLKKQIGDAEVVAVTLGKEAAECTLRSALAMGADRGVFIRCDYSPDSMVTARALKAAIEQDGRPDIIFTGSESIDAEGFQTMFRLGAALKIPVVSNVVAFKLEGRFVTAECKMDAGSIEVIRIPLPCIVGTGKALNQPRYPTLPDIMKARKKPIRSVALDSLGLDCPPAGMEVVELRPAVEGRRSKIIAGSPEEAVKELVRLLKAEARVI